MSVLYISEVPAMGVAQGASDNAISGVSLVEQTVAITGASLQSAPFSAATRMVRISTDAVCSIAFGVNPTATTAKKRFAANQSETFRVTPGHRVAVITNT